VSCCQTRFRHTGNPQKFTTVPTFFQNLTSVQDSQCSTVSFNLMSKNWQCSTHWPFVQLYSHLEGQVLGHDTLQWLYRCLFYWNNSISTHESGVAIRCTGTRLVKSKVFHNLPKVTLIFMVHLTQRASDCTNLYANLYTKILQMKKKPAGRNILSNTFQNIYTANDLYFNGRFLNLR